MKAIALSAFGLAVWVGVVGSIFAQIVDNLPQ